MVAASMSVPELMWAWAPGLAARNALAGPWRKRKCPAAPKHRSTAVGVDVGTRGRHGRGRRGGRRYRGGRWRCKRGIPDAPLGQHRPDTRLLGGPDDQRDFAGLLPGPIQGDGMLFTGTDQHRIGLARAEGPKPSLGPQKDLRSGPSRARRNGSYRPAK